jgi:hypothetical protein
VVVKVAAEEDAVEAEDGKKPEEERELLRGGCCGGLGEGRRKECSWLSRREVARRRRQPQPQPVSTTATWRHPATGNCSCSLPPRRALADDDDDIVRCLAVVWLAYLGSSPVHVVRSVCVTEMTAPVKEEEWTGPPFYMRDLAIWVEVKGTGGVGPASREWDPDHGG